MALFFGIWVVGFACFSLMVEKSLTAGLAPHASAHPQCQRAKEGLHAQLIARVRQQDQKCCCSKKHAGS